MAGHGDDWSAFMAANWALHERIAAVTPNGLARAVYVGTIRCVAELSVHAQTEEKEDAEEYLRARVRCTRSSSRRSSPGTRTAPARQSRRTAGSASVPRTLRVAPPDPTA